MPVSGSAATQRAARALLAPSGPTCMPMDAMRRMAGADDDASASPPAVMGPAGASSRDLHRFSLSLGGTQNVRTSHIWGKSRKALLSACSRQLRAWRCTRCGARMSDPFFEENNGAVKVKNWVPAGNAGRDELQFAYCPMTAVLLVRGRKLVLRRKTGHLAHGVRKEKATAPVNLLSSKTESWRKKPPPHTLPSSTHTHRPILVTRPRDSREGRDSLRQATPGRYRRGARSARAPRTACFTFILNKGLQFFKMVRITHSARRADARRGSHHAPKRSPHACGQLLISPAPKKLARQFARRLVRRTCSALL